jgi:hypothetical protein
MPLHVPDEVMNIYRSAARTRLVRKACLSAIANADAACLQLCPAQVDEIPPDGRINQALSSLDIVVASGELLKPALSCHDETERVIYLRPGLTKMIARYQIALELGAIISRPSVSRRVGVTGPQDDITHEEDAAWARAFLMPPLAVSRALRCRTPLDLAFGIEEDHTISRMEDLRLSRVRGSGST